MSDTTADAAPLQHDAAMVEERLQRLAAQQLHRDVGVVAAAPVVEDLDAARVPDRARRLRREVPGTHL